MNKKVSDQKPLNKENFYIMSFLKRLTFLLEVFSYAFDTCSARC